MSVFFTFTFVTSSILHPGNSVRRYKYALMYEPVKIQIAHIYLIMAGQLVNV
jgi:hypothetical protein